MTLDEIKQLIIDCLQQVYSEEPSLFGGNDGKGLCERCLVFRFAYYLQNAMETGYFVDCDYNSSFIDGQQRSTKEISGIGRYIDIIVHKRTNETNSDFICFELKKWNNYQGRDKDRNNLRVLTTEYGYRYGFHVILGNSLNNTKWSVFGRNQQPSDYELISSNESNN